VFVKNARVLAIDFTDVHANTVFIDDISAFFVQISKKGTFCLKTSWQFLCNRLQLQHQRCSIHGGSWNVLKCSWQRGNM